MGRTPIDKPRTKNIKKQKEITSALFPVFMEKGIHSLSTEDICNITGKSKATLYKYFESKKEMVQFILEERLSELYRFSDFLNDATFDHKTRYKNAVSVTINAIDGISPLFLSDLSEHYPDLYKGILDLKRLSLDLLKDFYADGIKKNVFMDLSADLLVMNDNLFFTAILESDFIKNQDLNLKEIFEGYFKIRFNGILK